MGIIQKFFNKGNETKLDQLTVAQGELNSKVSELNSKLSQVAGALKIARTHLMIDESATNKKSVEKLEKAQEKFNSELSSTQAELSKVSSEIASITQEELHAELVQAAKQDAESMEYSEKHYKVKKLFQAKINRIDNFMVGFTPNNLRSLAKRRGDLEFTHERDTTGKINADYQEVLNEESRKVHAKIDKDFEEFLKAFNKYFGEGN